MKKVPLLDCDVSKYKSPKASTHHPLRPGSAGNIQKYAGLGGQLKLKCRFESYPVNEVANQDHLANKVLQFHLAIHTKHREKKGT